jgi:hypothetical protein
MTHHSRTGPSHPGGPEKETDEGREDVLDEPGADEEESEEVTHDAKKVRKDF